MNRLFKSNVMVWIQFLKLHKIQLNKADDKMRYSNYSTLVARGDLVIEVEIGIVRYLKKLRYPDKII